MYLRAHRQLLALNVHRSYVSQAHDDVYHHLSHRHYLAKDLPLRERVRCVLSHYSFEEKAFDDAYKRAVYRDGGLPLWQHDDPRSGLRFDIRLEMASRLCAEGDLTIALGANGTCLHRLSFSWVDGVFVGLAAPTVPFIARNQGHRADAADAFAAFEQAFPHNSPSYFCFTALQGIAQALGFKTVAAVKAASQSAYSQADARHFTNAYDSFWEKLGGVETAGFSWQIALPFYIKPLSEVPAKHRKRATLRREHWQAISDSARLAIACRRQ